MHLNNIRDPKSGADLVHRPCASSSTSATRNAPITLGARRSRSSRTSSPGIAGRFSVLGRNGLTDVRRRRVYRQHRAAVGRRAQHDRLHLPPANLFWNNTPFACHRQHLLPPAVCGALGLLDDRDLELPLGPVDRCASGCGMTSTSTSTTRSATRSTTPRRLQTCDRLRRGLIFNPLDLERNYANSDFDVRHIVNANWVVGLPVGQGKAWLERPARGRQRDPRRLDADRHLPLELRIPDQRRWNGQHRAGDQPPLRLPPLGDQLAEFGRDGPGAAA